MEDATTTESVDAPQPAANGGSVAAKRPARKGKLGKTLGSHVDPSASAFPVSLLSDNAAEGLRPQRDSGILTGAMTKSAVFWDRDNTLIEDPGYLSDPAQVKLLPGASAALRRLADAGYENIVITNQSGIARGLFDEAALEKVHARLHELLAGEGARLDAIYYCPYLDGPEAVVEKYRQDSDLRKPRPGMLAQASLERRIDLAGSWMIGNSLGDTQAGRAAGCRTILVAGDDAARDKSVDFMARSLEEAAGIVLKYTAGVQAAIPSEPPARPDAAAADAVRKELTVVGSRVEEILSFLRMVDRRQQAEDFSLGRLVGIVVQMVAVAAMVWAVFSFIRSEEYGAQIVRLLFALVLQMLALTCFLLASRK